MNKGDFSSELSLNKEEDFSSKLSLEEEEDLCRICDSITRVTWDVDDCPIPKDVNLVTVSDNIRLALEKLGVYNEQQPEIDAFGVEEEIGSSDELFKAGIFYVSGGDKENRVNSMLCLLINFASLDYGKLKNLMIISKNLPNDTEFARVLRALKSRGTNVLLVQPPPASSNELLRTADSISDCTVVLDGGKPPLMDQTATLYQDFSKPITYVDGRMTGVFWDVQESPLPNHLDPESIYQKLESALEEKCYFGEMSIWVYAEEITFPDELLDKYRNSKIYFLPQVPRDKNARYNRMLHDILLWAMDTPDRPSNVIVISNNIHIQGDNVNTHGIPRIIDFMYSLPCLYARGFNAFLVQPNKLTPEMSVTSEWPASLLDIGEVIVELIIVPVPKRKRKKEKVKKTPATFVSISSENKSENSPSSTMNSNDFSKPITHGYGPKTGVFWDVEDSPLPNDLDPQSIYQKLKSALEEKGYYGEMLIWAYAEKIPSFPDEMLHEYRKSKIYFIPGGVKMVRVSRMLHDILLWEMDTPVHYPTECNLIVIANNIPDDDDFIECLECSASGGYNNLLVQPAAKPKTLEGLVCQWPRDLLDVGKHIGRISYYSKIGVLSEDVEDSPLPNDLDPQSALEEKGYYAEICPEENRSENSRSNTMDSYDFSRAYTHIFWYVDDYPIPKDIEPNCIYHNIILALANMGYYGLHGLEAYAYSEKDIPLALDDESMDLQKIVFFPNCSFKSMLLDIMNNARTRTGDRFNLMFISKKLTEDEESLRVLWALRSRGSNVLLVQPRDEAESESLFHTPDSISDCTRFLNGEKPMKPSVDYSSSTSWETDTDTETED